MSNLLKYIITFLILSSSISAGTFKIQDSIPVPSTEIIAGDNDNHINGATMSAYTDPGTGGHRKAFVKFNLSSISGTLSSAVVKMCVVSSAIVSQQSDTLQIRRVLQIMVYDEADNTEYSDGNSWATAGAKSIGTDIGLVIDSLAFSSTAGDTLLDGETISFNVLPEIDSMIAGQITNNGFTISWQGDGTHLTLFDGSGAAVINDDLRPYLEVTFTPSASGNEFGNRMFPLIIQSADSVDSDLTDFVMYVNKFMFPYEALDADGPHSALNGGGDILFFAESLATTRLPIDIVDFEIFNHPVDSGKVQIYTLNPDITFDDNDTIWGFYDKTGATQPAAGAAFGSEVVHVNRIAVYHLDDASAAKDATANDLDMTDLGTPTYEVSGQLGFGVDFDGNSSDRLVVDKEDVLDTISFYTISAWVMPDSLTSNDDGRIVSLNLSTANDVYALTFSNPSSVPIIKHRLTTGATTTLSGTNSVPLDEFNLHHIRYTGDSMTIAFNGVEDVSLAKSGAISTIGNRLVIGGHSQDAARWFPGIVDEVVITYGALSEAYIAAEFSNQFHTTGFADNGTPFNTDPPPIIVIIDTLEVLAVTGFPNDDWTKTAGASSKITAVDGTHTAAQYIFEDDDFFGGEQRFTTNNPTKIDVDDIIDSVVLSQEAWASTSFPPMPLRSKAIVGSSTLLGTLRDVSHTSPVTYTDVFITQPAGGAWTLGALDSLDIELDASPVIFFEETRCSRFLAIVYATPAPPDTVIFILDTTTIEPDFRYRELLAKADTVDNKLWLLGWPVPINSPTAYECSVTVTFPDLITDYDISTFPTSTPHINDSIDYVIAAIDSSDVQIWLLFYEIPDFTTDTKILQFPITSAGLKIYEQSSTNQAGTRADSLFAGQAFYHDEKYGDIIYPDSTTEYNTGKLAYMGGAIFLDSLGSILKTGVSDTTRRIDVSDNRNTLLITLDSTYFTDAALPVAMHATFNKLQYGSVRYPTSAYYVDMGESTSYHGPNDYVADVYKFWLDDFTNGSPEDIRCALFTDAADPTNADTMLESVSLPGTSISGVTEQSFFSVDFPLLRNGAFYWLGFNTSDLIGSSQWNGHFDEIPYVGTNIWGTLNNVALDFEIGASGTAPFENRRHSFFMQSAFEEQDRPQIGRRRRIINRSENEKDNIYNVYAGNLFNGRNSIFYNHCRIN